MNDLDDNSYILDKINFCLGISNALYFILLNNVCAQEFSEQQYNSILSLSECLDEKLNLLSMELRNKL